MKKTARMCCNPSVVLSPDEISFTNVSQILCKPQYYPFRKSKYSTNLQIIQNNILKNHFRSIPSKVERVPAHRVYSQATELFHEIATDKECHFFETRERSSSAVFFPSELKPWPYIVHTLGSSFPYFVVVEKPKPASKFYCRVPLDPLRTRTPENNRIHDQEFDYTSHSLAKPFNSTKHKLQTSNRNIHTRRTV